MNTVNMAAHGKRETSAHITSAVETIGPAMALAILANNPENRVVRLLAVQSFATDMAAGRWHLNGQPIIIADDGGLNDGQHRLLAVVKAGLSVDFVVVRGTTRASRKTIDTGRIRTAGDILGMQGVKSADLCAGIARLVLGSERADHQNAGRTNDISRVTIVERVLSDPRIIYAAITAQHLRQIMTGSPAGYCRYRIADSDQSDNFFSAVATGELLTKGDPPLALRNFMIQHGRAIHSTKQAEALLRCWVAYKRQRPLTIIKILGAYPDDV